jgi:hypothetical protein
MPRLTTAATSVAQRSCEPCHASAKAETHFRAQCCTTDRSFDHLVGAGANLVKASSISLSLPAGAFAIVQSALNWLVDNYPRSDGRSV